MIYVFGPMTRLEITHLDLGWGGAHTEAEPCAKGNIRCTINNALTSVMRHAALLNNSVHVVEVYIH